jgi:hypothetical protein
MVRVHPAYHCSAHVDAYDQVHDHARVMLMIRSFLGTYFHVETSRHPRDIHSSVQAVRLATLRAEVTGNQVADILRLYLACVRGCVNHFFIICSRPLYTKFGCTSINVQ